MQMITNFLLVAGLALVAGSAHTRGRRETLDRSRVGVSLPANVITADRRHTAAFSNTDLTGVVTLYAAAGSRSLPVRRGQWFSRSHLPTGCRILRRQSPLFISKTADFPVAFTIHGGRAGILVAVHPSVVYPVLNKIGAN